MLNLLSRCLALFVAIGLPMAAMAETYPDKPIRMIIANAVGGGTDSSGRIIAQQLAKSMGQSVVVENYAGAGGVIGGNIAAKAAPNGYNIFYDSASFAVNPAIRKLPYDPEKDFIPLSLSISQPNILVVAMDSPYKTFADFLEAAKKQPGALTFGSAGVGTGQHMTGELFKNVAQVDMLHVPYKGGAAVYNDLIAGRITCYWGNAGSGMPFIKGQRVRPLAVTSAERHPALPDVPTMKELGFKDFEVLEWAGAYVPAGTPDAVVQRLSKELQMAVHEPAVKGSLEKMGVFALGTTQQDFKKFLAADFKRWKEVADKNNIKVD
jgi:tripartite-type tricarboxylate transporter receptor subunit TctC